MGQIKIYGLDTELNKYKNKISEVIHSCVVESFSFPADKKFHRFFPLSKEDFYYPAGRSEKYTLIEVSIFEGRSVEAKKTFIRNLFANLKKELNIDSNDIEITIFETPKHNWGIRGLPGDELELNYKVNV